MTHKPQDLCGCGNCDDSFDAALRLFKQSFKPEGEFCGAWAMAVAEQFGQLARMTALMWASEHNPEAPIEPLVHTINQSRDLIVLKTTLNDYQNPKRVAANKYICDEMIPNSSNVAVEYISKGMPEHIAKMCKEGIDEREGRGNGSLIDLIMAILRPQKPD